MESKIVYIRIDDWYDMGAANQYLDELMTGEHNEDVNYAEVWYDMASVFCITTTEEYAKAHNLMGHTTNIEQDLFGEYFPEYNPTNFGCSYNGGFKGWAPYKQFNAELYEAAKKKGLIKDE